MEHPGEIWQTYDSRGRRIMDGGARPGEPFSAYYAGVAIMLYRYRAGKVEFLFQHRAKTLRGNPDKWDVSAGGHINYDEPTLLAAVRETKEEIGVDIDPNRLELAASYLITTNRGFAYLYFYDWDNRPNSPTASSVNPAHPSEFRFNDHEVEEVKWVKYEDFPTFSEKLKPQLKNDEIFAILLKRWAAKILEKYGNH